MPSSKLFQRLTAVLLIIAATLLVYWPALRNGFVWDDTALVLRDPLIRSWRLIPEGFRHYLFLDATGSNFYRPVQRLSFTIDYALSAFEPAEWHFTSIAVHMAAAAALYAMLRRWWGEERWLWALGVALVWVVHPLHTSAVTYVSGRADPLAAVFGFAGLALALRGTRAAAAGAAACFLGALLSKESGAMAIAIWFVFLATREARAAVWIRWVAFAAIIFSAYFTLRFTGQKTPPPPPSQTASSVSRPVLMARAAAEYAGLIVAPVTLRMERDVREPAGAAPHTMLTLAGFAVIAGMITWWCWARQKAPLAAVALVAAAVAYLPVSNIFQLNATIAEHWMYVPSAFVFAAVAQSIAVSRAWLIRTSIALISIWTLWLCEWTWQRQADWADQRTFLTRTIASGGDSARMRVNLANLELGENHPDRALAEYDAALSRNPALIFAHFGKATAFLRVRDYPAARAALEKCESGRGLDAEILQLRAAIDFADRRIDPTPAYKAAAELAPLNWPHRKRYLTTLAGSGQLAEATRELRVFLEAQPYRADSWLLLANFLSRSAQRDFAGMALSEARERDVHLQIGPPTDNEGSSTTAP